MEQDFRPEIWFASGSGRLTKTADYDYALPPELIARYPPERRDQSRLLLLDRHSKTISNHLFGEFPGLIGADELVVLNNTRVIPARLRIPDRNAEIFLLKQLGLQTWKALVRPGKSFQPGRSIVLPGNVAKVLEVGQRGERLIQFEKPVDLAQLGEVPLPPYLGRSAEPLDTERYQTIFASQPGAVAAPTAGLHFTPEVLAQLRHVFVTLHVGPGTFQPVQSELVTDHRMHEEEFTVTSEAAEQIESTKKIVAIGTTTVRVLETLALKGKIVPGSGRTDIFIFPPFHFQKVTSLLTNFHLPRSTLLMLVSAFAGRELILRAYREAIAERYRFFSYGDCMLIR
jgi:S-adenosylmethionine:tRNA ribosyltransferase-isomerase